MLYDITGPMQHLFFLFAGLRQWKNVILWLLRPFNQHLLLGFEHSTEYISRASLNLYISTNCKDSQLQCLAIKCQYIWLLISPPPAISSGQGATINFGHSCNSQAFRLWCEVPGVDPCRRTLAWPAVAIHSDVLDTAIAVLGLSASRSKHQCYNTIVPLLDSASEVWSPPWPATGAWGVGGPHARLAASESSLWHRLRRWHRPPEPDAFLCFRYSRHQSCRARMWEGEQVWWW